MTIGERIRAARLKVGITQEELATKLNITYQSIGQWERGKRTPKPETLKRIADALGVPVSEFAPGIWEKFDLQYPDKKSELSEYDGFITYLNTLGFTVKDSVVKWYEEPMTDDDGEIVGYGKVEDESEFILTKDKYSATFTETEFKALQNGTRESVEGVFFRKVVEAQKKQP